ncbi:MAG: hypothetical protein ACPG7F_21610 [Aggregatilineales bacterium]
MSIKQITFSIPDWISLGLETGELERVGGVIRQAGNKRIVAWLRDFPEIGGVDVLQSLGTTTRTAVALSGGGALLTMALGTATLVTLRNNFKQLSGQLNSLDAALRAEFEQERDAEFLSALRTANMVLTTSNAETRRDNALNAVNRLYKVQENFDSNYQKLIDEQPIPASYYLNRAMYAATACARCYLEIDEHNSARQSIHDDLRRLQVRIRQAVETLMGKYPALYLHPTIERGDVSRFLDIQRWLKSRDLMDIIHDLRRDFWNEEIMQSPETGIGRFNPIRTIQGISPLDATLARLPEQLTLAEVLIENENRLRIYEQEILFMQQNQYSLAEWEDLATDDMLREAKSGIAIIELEIPLDSSDTIL